MKAFLNWSGGKDSAFCLYTAVRSGLPVGALVTTVNAESGRVSMHGVPWQLVEEQAAALSLPVIKLELGKAGLDDYEALVSESNRKLRAQGFTHAVSGDLFLDDLKLYREGLYAGDGLGTLFPLWKLDTKKLLSEFIAAGFRAIVVCVNSGFLDSSYCGRILDQSFIDDLPEGTDPCGENGEYHSFVFDGPGFREPVLFDKGDIVYREYPAPVQRDCFTDPQPAAGFYFLDLIVPR